MIVLPCTSVKYGLFLDFSMFCWYETDKCEFLLPFFGVGVGVVVLYKKPRKFLVVTLTLPSLTLKHTIAPKRKRRIRMMNPGIDQRNRRRGEWVAAAFLRSTSPANWKAATWLTKIMKYVPQICLRGFRWVYAVTLNLHWLLKYTVYAVLKFTVQVTCIFQLIGEF